MKHLLKPELSALSHVFRRIFKHHLFILIPLRFQFGNHFILYPGSQIQKLLQRALFLRRNDGKSKLFSLPANIAFLQHKCQFFF